MRYMFTDGGRSLSKRPKQFNDCAVIAVATLLHLPYDTVFDELKRRGRKRNDGFYFPTGHAEGPAYGELLGHWFDFTPVDPIPLNAVVKALPDCLTLLEVYDQREHMNAVRKGVVWDFTPKPDLVNAPLRGYWTATKIRA